MLAFLFCLGLFLFWWTVGFALVRSLHGTRSIVQDVLLAPPVGLVVTVLPVWTISRMGLPVSKFGWAVALVLFVVAAFVLFRLYRRGANDPRYPGIPWKMMWPFFAVLVVALIATVRPMFAFGFDWVSYCNDDMANYCLAADRFYNKGFFDFPASETLLRGSNWSDAFWFMYVMIRQRPGCELVLAWAMSISGLNAHEVFMPVIVAMFLGLVTASSALVMYPSERRKRKAAEANPLEISEPNLTAGWVTGAMVSLSALTTLGVMYQLIAQVVGLSLVATIAAMILRPFNDLSKSNLLRHGVLVGIMGAGQLLIYPEVSPFLGLSFFAYAAIALVTRRSKPLPLLAVVAIAVAGVFLLLRVYATQAIGFLLVQAQATQGDITVIGIQRTLFPYYMVPKGLADLWGFQRIGAWNIWHGWIDASILAGALLAVFAALSAAWFTLRSRAEATIAFVMFAMGILLFKNRSGFGLFKLAMFIQPFALGTLVISWFAIVRLINGWIERWRKPKPDADNNAPGWRTALFTRVFQIAPLALITAAGLWTQGAYVRSSYGIGTAFLEISDPSRTRINDEFNALLNKHNPREVISDTFNMVLAKFQALHAIGRELVFPSNRFTLNIEALSEFETLKSRLTPEQVKQSMEYVVNRNGLMPVQEFDPKDPLKPDLLNLFRVTDRQLDPVLSRADRETDQPATPSFNAGPGGTEPLMVVSVGRQSVFNRFHFSADSENNFVAMPLSQAKNILIYISSNLGPPYFFTGTDRQPTVYQMENEPKASPFFPGATMCGAGRYMLAEVVNPSPKLRLTISLTLSYHSDKENLLPPKMAAIGEERVPFPVVGRGSARVFSAPFEPQWIEGRPYVMSDLGSSGRKFPDERLGLMKLFGKDVPLDRRVLSAFTRDISLVSEEDYANLRPPSWIGGFKPDKTNPLRNNSQLEYSGFYEDGWVAEDSYVRLLQPAGATEVIIRGMVPLVANDTAYRTRAILSVDGQTIAERELSPGDFVLRGPAPTQTTTAPTTQPAGLPVPSTAERSAKAPGPVRTVRLQFTGPVRRLPDPDNRPASASLKSIGFQAPTSVAQK